MCLLMKLFTELICVQFHGLTSAILATPVLLTSRCV